MTVVSDTAKMIYLEIRTNPARRRVLQEIGWAGPLVESKMSDEDKVAVVELLNDGAIARVHGGDDCTGWLLDTTDLGKEVVHWLGVRNKRCPTCKVNPGICCICKQPIEKWEQILEPDPYDDDLKGDDRHHLQHDLCKILAADEL